MNKEQLQQNIEKMEKELAEMRANLNKKEWKSFPQKGDNYWTYLTDGYIINITARDDNGRVVNSYRTKEEAERARDIAFARKRLTDRIEQLNAGWIPNWNDENDNKYFYVFTRDSISIDCWYVSKSRPNNMYMKSIEIAKQILSEMEYDIRLVLSE